VQVGGLAYLVLATPIAVGGRDVGVLVAAADLARFRAEVAQVALLAGAEALVALLAAVGSAAFLARRVLRTVGDVTAAALDASEGDLGRRLDDRGADDELGVLAGTFNRMLDRISGAMQAERQLLSDVSHQLRTPLTVVRGHLEVLLRTKDVSREELDETMALVLDELDRTALLVDRLLLLGRALEPGFLEEDRVDLRALFADVFAAASVLAERAWTMDPVPDREVLVDEAKLRGALLNLVDNAVKATRPADRIVLAARCEDEVVLSVSDTGCGIAPEDQATVFERFRRLERSDGRGAGLGLAIVKAVAEAHGGRVELTSEPGRGTEVAIVLPAARLVRTTQRHDEGSSDHRSAAAESHAPLEAREGLP
jgi:two-component system OmpR family sensor kinase